MVKLIKTDSNYSVFDVLCERIAPTVNRLEGRNLIFCEEKISLMAERAICAKFNGSFNTDVYSFGNYLRAKKNLSNVLSKEGSAMAVKRILSACKLEVLKNSKSSLAPTLFELISQLKSSMVSPDDLQNVLEQEGEKIPALLKNKLSDVLAVYRDYEEFLNREKYHDQSSFLSFLPEVLKNDGNLPNSDVYLLGFSSFTSQTKEAIATLLDRAKSVTAILVCGQNSYAYVNETVGVFKKLCASRAIECEEISTPSSFSLEQRTLANGLFNPLYTLKGQTEVKDGKIPTEKIRLLKAPSVFDEVMRIAQTIKKAVVETGARYREFTLAIENLSAYKEAIEKQFALLDIPYFIDERKKPQNHPLVLLVLNFFDFKRKGYSKQVVCDWVKNPLICGDKDFADQFIKYLKKYNLFYSRLLDKLVYPAKNQELFDRFESFRAQLVGQLETRSILALLDKINAQKTLDEYTEKLSQMGEGTQSAINAQIYDAVIKILNEQQMILGDVDLSYSDVKNVFLSGISALELSIIPQYNDAVFIGGLKQASLCRANNLFVAGLTLDVPSASDDVALLCDDDIDRLQSVKVMIEPKIKVVNRRNKENVALGVCAFKDRLYLSYPFADGNSTVKKPSEIYEFAERTFTTKDFPEEYSYYTKKQGLMAFAKDCSDYYDGLITDFTDASSFFKAVDDDGIGYLLSESKKQVKIKLDSNCEVLIKNVISPTAIENFYACPYKSFLKYGLKLRDEEEGVVDALSCGNVMHEIFAEYLLEMDSVTDRQSSDALFEKHKTKVLQKEEYAKFLKDEKEAYALGRAMKECKDYCYKTFTLKEKSLFVTEKGHVEVPFDDFAKSEEDKNRKSYPAISLCDGSVKMIGRIDRIDTFGDYARVIDYKTGGYDHSIPALYTGRKLQLYLYGAAINDKKLAGMYYYPINADFKAEKNSDTKISAGRTLADVELINAQDVDFIKKGESDLLDVEYKKQTLKGAVDAKTMDALVKYAVVISEKAVKSMKDGLIVASPFEKTCESCEFSAMCGRSDQVGRTMSSLKEEFILQSLEAEEGTDERQD